jgi:acyl-CoA hydrolase
VGGRQVSGQGGLCEFLRGAQMSDGGRGILALPSTAKNGTVSRIVASLSPGAPVTVGRADADIVVTEHGIAELRHKSPADRARALIAIADPAFREDLARAWTDRLASKVAA